jgi:hypothetical protein
MLSDTGDPSAGCEMTLGNLYGKILSWLDQNGRGLGKHRIPHLSFWLYFLPSYFFLADSLTSSSM